MPRIADYIDQHADDIVRRYYDEVGRLPSAKGLTYYETIDTLHEYLSTLANVSRTSKRENTEQTARRLEETHLALRLRIGFTQEEVIGEYALMGRLITELWEHAPASEQPDADDVRLLTDERAGSGNLPGHRGCSRRNHLGRQRRGRWQHVLLHDPATPQLTLRTPGQHTMSTGYSDNALTRAETDAVSGAVVLDFGTDWCSHCRAAEPLVTQALASRPDIRHIKIEDGSGRRLGRSYGVKLWPTLIFLKDGQEVARLVRPRSGSAITAALAKLAG